MSFSRRTLLGILIGMEYGLWRCRTRVSGVARLTDTLSTFQLPRPHQRDIRKRRGVDALCGESHGPSTSRPNSRPLLCQRADRGQQPDRPGRPPHLVSRPGAPKGHPPDQGHIHVRPADSGAGTPHPLGPGPRGDPLDPRQCRSRPVCNQQSGAEGRREEGNEVSNKTGTRDFIFDTRAMALEIHDPASVLVHDGSRPRGDRVPGGATRLSGT
jgi:diadenosine tetraphosphatase ApaH/serine/threonine PP2A family protein phosphatase